MIIVNIIGGLGNQMFQYACGRALSNRICQPLHLSIDQFHRYSLHSGYELQSVFHVNSPFATEFELRNILGWRARPVMRRIFGRPSMRWATGRNWCNEPFFQYWQGINQVHTPVYMHGYWQSENYFKDESDSIRKAFTFKMPCDNLDCAVIERMRMQPSASMHIRRGDYNSLKNKRIFAICDIKYYQQAVNILRQRVPDVRIFAFTDDPDWVESELKADLGLFEIVRHNSGSRSSNDMRLMSNADHHIIANSSFSWWGAWLNPSPEKIVIAPRQWFLNGTNDTDLIPSSWIRL
jgi:hypothetical protein